MTTDEEPGAQRSRCGLFSTTHWSVVLRAGDATSPQVAEALEQLCRVYWRPLYTFVLREGRSPDDAQDLTQEFFTRFLDGNHVARADRDKGRFRSFLLGSMKHFLANEWDHARAVKRGGRCTFISWDELPEDDSFRLETATPLDSDHAYERQWVLTVLECVFARLREECTAAGKSRLFEALRDALSGERHPGDAGYGDIGAQLGMSAGAVQVALHRLRRRYGQLLREEIAHTVKTPKEIDEEIRHLFRALRP